MDLENLIAVCPDYAKDLRLNMGAVLRQSELTERQTWGTAVCSAIAARNARLTAAILEEAGKRIPAADVTAARTAAALMGMNNIFYRFRRLSGNPKYASMPGRLRMQGIRAHGSDPLDFELWCLAVSAIHGCGDCVEAHERVLREKGVGEEAILAAVRIASTIHALAVVMDAETAAGSDSGHAV